MNKANKKITCPCCYKGTFIHHNYSNYINYRCNDKKCNHSFFVAYFKFKSDNLLKNIDLSDSDEWHADETVVFINGKRHYL